jgi:hypothetical protein
MGPLSENHRCTLLAVLVTLLVVMFLLMGEQLIVGKTLKESPDGKYRDTWLYNLMSFRIAYTQLPNWSEARETEAPSKDDAKEKKSEFAPPSTIALSIRNGTGEQNNSWGACTTSSVYGQDSLAANISPGGDNGQSNFKMSSHRQGFTDKDLAAQL